MVSAQRIATRGVTALALASAFSRAGLMASPSLLAQQGEACAVSINSAPANDSTIELAKNDGVGVKVVAPQDSVRNDVYLKLFGQRVKIAEMEGAAGEFHGTTTVADVANWGVGLSEVVWESVDNSGAVLSTATARVRILGSPLGSIAGV